VPTRELEVTLARQVTEHMKVGAKAIVAAFVLVLLFGLVQVRTQDKPLVFIHATVIDATGAAAKPDMTVLMSGDRITAIGKTGTVRVPDSAEVVDARGRFIIPGLWDMHVHLGNYKNGKNTLTKLAQYGVTGMRDMASPVDDILRLRQETSESRLGGPRMVVAGPILQRPLPFQLPPMVRTVASPAEARNAVDALKRLGVDFIKVGDSLERDVYFSVADESKRLRIPFVGHLPVLSDEAVRALPEEQRNFLAVMDGQHVLFKTPARFVNHSCNPNARGSDRCDIATRRIEASEEITVDYVAEQVPGLRLQCNCRRRIAADC
jgi:hypothetical protein